MKKGRITKKSILILTIAVIVAAACVWRYVSLNAAWPNPVLESHGVNQPMQFNGFEMTLIDSKMVDGDGLQQIAPDYIVDESPLPKPNSDFRFWLATVKIKNTGSAEAKCDIGFSTVESNDFGNGMDIYLFQAVNPDVQGDSPSIKPGEEITVTLPFSMMKEQFKPADWANVEKRKFDVVMSFYPVKKVFALN